MLLSLSISGALAFAGVAKWDSGTLGGASLRRGEGARVPGAAETRDDPLPPCGNRRVSSMQTAVHRRCSQRVLYVLEKTGEFMGEFDREAFRRRACTCGPPAEECVPDEMILVQQTWNRGTFRIKPRYCIETAVSVLMAEEWTLEELCVYVNRGQPVSPGKVSKAGRRRTTAKRLRDAGFAVVHTPGNIEPGLHVSVVWPPADPFRHQDPQWGSDVQQRFDACFNGDEER